MVERLRKPGTLLVVAVVCLASAVGNGLYDFSNLATVAFSVLGSLFLAAAIVSASVAHSRTPRGTRHRIALGRDAGSGGGRWSSGRRSG